MRPVLANLGIAVLIAAVANAQPEAFEPERDPSIGFNLISFSDFRDSVWVGSVDACVDAGFDEVTLCPFRFVDVATGSLNPSSGGGDFSHIAAGLARAETRGAEAAVNAFIFAEGFSVFRGTLQFTGGTRATFFQEYTDYVVGLAEVAELNGAERLVIGTEISGLVNDPLNEPFWHALIEAVDTVFSGEIGYAANWPNYKSSQLTASIWDHPAIDFLGIDAYFPLATTAEADATGPGPDEAFVQSIEAEWNQLLDAQSGGLNGILSFAAARQGGSGLPVEFTEFGLIPFNRTTVEPFSEAPFFAEQPVDQDEQIDGYRGLIRALDGRQGVLPRVTLWHWGMPGANESLWYTSPDITGNIGGSRFDESLNTPAAEFLQQYITTPGCGFADFGEPFGTIDTADIETFLDIAENGCESEPTPGALTFDQKTLLGLGTAFDGVVLSTTPAGDGVIVTGEPGQSGTLAIASDLADPDLSTFSTFSLDVRVTSGAFDLTKMFLQSGAGFFFSESPPASIGSNGYTTVTIDLDAIPQPNDVRAFGFQFFNETPGAESAIEIRPTDLGRQCPDTDLDGSEGPTDAFDLLELLRRIDCEDAAAP